MAAAPTRTTPPPRHADAPSAGDTRPLPNLGPASWRMLAAAGICTPDALRQLGAVHAYARVRATPGGTASLNLLWALEGALTGLPWQQVAREHRTSLLLALETHQRLAGGPAPPCQRTPGEPSPARPGTPSTRNRRR